MKSKILYIERKPSESVSIERVFRQIAKSLSKERFEVFSDRLPYSNDTISTLKNLIFYRKPSADIYHITGHIHYIALILPKRKTVLTIHDVRILYIRKGLRRFILKKLLFDLPVKKLKYITAISEATKKEIVFYTKCDEKKIRVIENPLPDKIFQNDVKVFNAECPLILQIGTTDNKNVNNLVKALQGISCRLRIIGEISAELEKILKDNQIFYENASGLNDFEIRNEYEKADIVAFCSTYEGFGLPIIEAQAMGKPVITSNLDPMKEVAGGAAILVDPYETSSIREGILQIINDENYRKILFEKGLENIKRFESSHIAGLYENLYLEIMENEKNG
jgi:glycosyltransferase involved in cell wall biosynthesis